jgi:hypothetical protein
MSRSIRRRSFSRRRREISEAESEAESGAGAGIGCSTAPEFPRLRQLRSIEGEMPSSLAICSNGRPLLSSSAQCNRLSLELIAELTSSLAHSNHSILRCGSSRLMPLSRCASVLTRAYPYTLGWRAGAILLRAIVG